MKADPLLFQFTLSAVEAQLVMISVRFDERHYREWPLLLFDRKGKLNSVSALTKVGNFKTAKALLISFLGALATLSSIHGKPSPVLIQAQNTWVPFWF